MKKNQTLFSSFLPLLLLFSLLLTLAACSPATASPRATSPVDDEYPYPYPINTPVVPENSEYPLPTPNLMPTLNPYPYPGPGETTEPIEWQRVDLPEAGLALDVPADWKRIEGDEILWESEPGRPNHLGVKFAPIGPGQMLEAVFLPPDSVVLEMVEVPLSTGVGNLFTIQVMDSAAGQGTLKAVEQHLVFLAPGGRGYDVFISASNPAELGWMQTYFVHIRTSIVVNE